MISTENRKGLAVVYDPHNLHQFIWYYCANGLNKSWDALCLPNGPKGCYMHPYCERAGIFLRVFTGDIDYLELSYKKKAKIFLEMLLYFIIGARKKWCKKLLNQYVENIDDYDEVVIISDTGFVSGACTTFGKEKKVVLLDDGIADYDPRSRWKCSYKFFSLTYWQGLFLAKMGYSCKGRFYFSQTKNCYKYCAAVDKMQYTNYKEMLPLFDMSNTDEKLYNVLIKKIYPDIEKIDFDSLEAVLFPGGLMDYFDDCQDYYNRCTKYIGERYKSVLIKKHPRDDAQYIFADSVKVQRVSDEIPAEVLLPYLKNVRIFFTYPSSIMLFMQPYSYESSVFYSQEIYKPVMGENGDVNYLDSKGKSEEYCRLYAGDNYEIIEV